MIVYSKNEIKQNETIEGRKLCDEEEVKNEKDKVRKSSLHIPFMHKLRTKIKQLSLICDVIQSN